MPPFMPVGARAVVAESITKSVESVPAEAVALPTITRLLVVSAVNKTSAVDDWICTAVAELPLFFISTVPAVPVPAPAPAATTILPPLAFVPPAAPACKFRVPPLEPVPVPPCPDMTVRSRPTVDAALAAIPSW